MATQPQIWGDTESHWMRFLGRVLIVAGVVLVLAAIWFATRVFLLAFLGTLFGILLVGLADMTRKVLPLSHGWALTLVVIGLLLMMGLASWLVGGQLVQQLGQLGQQVPESWQEVRQQVKEVPAGAWAVEQMPTSLADFGRSDLYSQFSSALSSAVAFVVGLIIILFVGLYLAAEPQWYENGVALLAPPKRRAHVMEALGSTAAALRYWLVGQLVAMTIVGVATGLGLWALGIPLAFGLGLLAFALEIIPNFGPVLSAIPALLIAWTQGTSQFWWVLALYMGIQTLESYVISPLVQQRAVRLPPALSILAVVLFGLVAGPLGVFAAAPLTVAMIVLIKVLYVQDVLGDHRVRLPVE